MVRNYAKPFCIAGFILAEIYMLFVVLAPYGNEGRVLPAPIPFETTVAPGTPAPTSYKVGEVLVASIFFGPLGALVGLGVGLIFSSIVHVWHRK